MHTSCPCHVEEAESLDRACPEDEGAVPRAAAGTNIAMSNVYWALIDNAKFNNCVLRFHARWADDLGEEQKSNTLVRMCSGAVTAPV